MQRPPVWPRKSVAACSLHAATRMRTSNGKHYAKILLPRTPGILSPLESGDRVLLSDEEVLPCHGEMAPGFCG